MTPQQLDQLNSRIYEAILSHQPRHRLLYYALNRNLLSDLEYRQIKQARPPEETLLNAPWALALFWARLFYEEGDGNNYRKVIISCLGITDAEGLFHRIHVACGWFPENNEILSKPIYRFQSECWMTSIEGGTSKLWKCLPQFIRKARPGCSDPEMCNLDGVDEDDIFPPILWLVKNNDSDFCSTLRWLSNGGENDSVGDVIASNLIWQDSKRRDDFQAKLGICLFDGHPEIVLKIGGIWFGSHDSGGVRRLVITQNEKQLLNFDITKGTTSLILRSSIFTSPLNLSEPFQVFLGNCKLDSDDIGAIPWATKELLLFKPSGDGSFCKSIRQAENRPQHLQGRFLYVAGRPSDEKQPSLQIGDVALCAPKSCGVVQYDNALRHIYQYDLGIVQADNRPLREVGTNDILAHIGRKPFLELDQAVVSRGWKLPGDDQTVVVIGTQSVAVSARNFIGGEIEWSVFAKENGIQIAGTLLTNRGDSTEALLTVDRWGKRYVLKARAGEQEAKVRLLFLPSLESSGVAWNPAMDDADAHFPIKAFSLARGLGVEAGIILFPGGQLPVFKPITRPSWGWREQINPLSEYNTRRNFKNHHQVENWQLEYALPPGGEWSLTFNGKVVSKESGRIALEQLVRDYIGPEHLTSGQLAVPDKLTFTRNGQESASGIAAEIQRLPEFPILGIIDGIPSVYLPETTDTAGFRLVALRESDLLGNTLHNVSLARNAGVHPIQDLPAAYQNEGAWLVLLDFRSVSHPPTLNSIHDFIEHLTSLPILGVCAVSPQLEEQTFPALLQLWHGDSLCDRQRQQVRTRLDFLEHQCRKIADSRRIDGLFERARRMRHSLGYGSRELVEKHFRDRLLESLRLPSDEFSKLLHLLLECGFNWLAERDWVESIHHRAQALLSERNQRLTKALKKAIQDGCPLNEAFERIHNGECENIPCMVNEFFDVGEEIGLSIACPFSGVPQFRNGLSYRGVLPDRGRFSGRIRLHCENPRPVSWPEDFRNPVRMTDSHGQDEVIILKITNPEKVAAYFEDQIPIAETLDVEEQAKDRIGHLFQSSLASAGYFLADHGNQLGELFRICNDHFAAMAKQAEGQECRAFIFQIAVLSRLHAWVSKDAPKDWPLLEPSNYDAACSLTARLWKSQVHRRALMKDIAPVEWLLTWFKSPHGR